MKNKRLVIAVAVVALIAVVIFIKGSNVCKARAKKVVALQAASAKTPAKKAISKDMGGLTVKIQGANKKTMNLRIVAYKVTDKKSSIYAASLVPNNMQELLPGVYDIQIDTIPSMIYKSVQVSVGKETIEDLGVVTGTINVKLLNSKKKDAFLPLRILYHKSVVMVSPGVTNRAIELLPGKYDLDIGTLPRQTKKGVDVVAGKEAVIDLGLAMGTLTVKALDENNKESRTNYRVKKQDTNEVVLSGGTNRPVEVLKGVYDIELLSSPTQAKKGVVIDAGEESVAEFIVKAPPVKTYAAPKK
ncbi:MAG: hypothetical protein WC738_00300 [Candidatus Omnitrophota bacterium]